MKLQSQKTPRHTIDMSELWSETASRMDDFNRHDSGGRKSVRRWLARRAVRKALNNILEATETMDQNKLNARKSLGLIAISSQKIGDISSFEAMTIIRNNQLIGHPLKESDESLRAIESVYHNILKPNSLIESDGLDPRANDSMRSPSNIDLPS